MTRSEMIAYINANHYHKISHHLFDYEEYIYVGHDGLVYDENGYIFEDWFDPIRYDGIRDRKGGQWDDGWYVKEKVKPCEYYFTIPKIGVCCKAYSESKPTNENTWRHWAHYPNCTEENCPLLHTELLEGRKLEMEEN